MPAAVTRASVWWSLGSNRRRAGGEPRPSRARFRCGAAAELRARHPGAAKIDAGVDFDHRAAALRQRVHRPDRDLAVEPVKQAHAREARLGDLRRADRVIGAGGLAAALRVEPRVALAEVDEVGLHPVGDAEIEMPAVDAVSRKLAAPRSSSSHLRVDIGPELARGCSAVRLAGQIFAALDDRRGEAEVEAEQGRLLRARSSSQLSTSSRDQTWPGRISRGARIAARFGDGDALVPAALRARPVDRDVACEPHVRLRGLTGGLAAVQSRERGDHLADPLLRPRCHSAPARPAQPRNAAFAKRSRARSPSGSRSCRDRWQRRTTCRGSWLGNRNARPFDATLTAGLP